jgi:hypothetical protein
MFFLWFLLKVGDAISESKIQCPTKSNAIASIRQNWKSHMLVDWLMHKNIVYGMVCL